jgi:hypothetical protein
MKVAILPAVGLFVLVVGCSKAPDYVKTINTPIKGVTLTFETWSFVLASDTNKLIAHYEQNGEKATQLILQGDYVALSRFSWPSPQKLVLCYKSGAVRDFTNQVDLRIGSDTRRFHITLTEDC